jgi:hypothetical protein
LHHIGAILSFFCYDRRKNNIHHGVGRATL